MQCPYESTDLHQFHQKESYECMFISKQKCPITKPFLIKYLLSFNNCKCIYRNYFVIFDFISYLYSATLKLSWKCELIW